MGRPEPDGLRLLVAVCERRKFLTSTFAHRPERQNGVSILGGLRRNRGIIGMVRGRDAGFRLGAVRKTAVGEKLAGRSLAMDGHPADLPRRYLPASLRHASGSALFLFVPAADHDSHAWPRFTILREQLADWLCFVVAFPVAAIVAFAIKITCWLIGK